MCLEYRTKSEPKYFRLCARTGLRGHYVESGLARFTPNGHVSSSSPGIRATPPPVIKRKKGDGARHVR